MAGISQPLQLFGDFGFSGGQDVAPNPLQNNQIAINYYAEVNKQNPKEILGLLGAPGLVQLAFAPGGGVPTSTSITPSTSLRQVFEVAMTSPTWPTNIYGSNPQNCPIILSISPDIAVINRNYNASSYANSAGDGNVYHYSITTGALTSTTLQSAASTPFKHWSNYQTGGWAAAFQLSNGSIVNAGTPFIMQTSDDNALLMAPGGVLLSSVTQCVTNSGISWTVFGSGVFVFDFGKLLFNTSGFTGTDHLYAIYPCSDLKHAIFLTLGGGIYKWAIVNVVHGSEAVVSSGQISDTASQKIFNTGGIPGTSNAIGSNDPTTGTANGTYPLGCLQSDLQTLWILFYGQDPGSPTKLAQFVVLTVNPSTFDLKISLGLSSGQGTAAFPNSNAANAAHLASAIWADNGTAAMLCGQELTVWTFAGAAAGTAWPPVSPITSLPVRGLWELPNDSTALAVIGAICYLVSVATPATSTAFATLKLTSVGTLLTNIGPVHIRDNNAGGYAVIVDGPYGYLYNIATQAFAQITDPSFLGANRVVFIDGWWVFNQPGAQSQTFYTQAQQYGITFNASNFALKDGASDRLVSLQENKEQLWLLGDKTTEIWYDAGGQYFAFQRLVGTMLQFGCKAAQSPARFNTDGQDGIIWFGRSERGENQILRSRGFSVDVVSTPAFSAEVSQYPVVSDAIGYTYQEDTHEFYVLTFPTADTTWCYDSQSGLLHKRLSYDPYLQQFHRHRSNCFMNFQGMRIVGDYQCGSLYQMTRNAFTDAGWPILAKRRSPHVWDKGQRGRVFMASLQIDFRQGVGNASGLGSNPQAVLQISRDGGKTFGQRWSAPIGKIGLYKNRTMWRKLAFGRDNVVDIEVIDPVPRDIVGVTLKAFSSA